MPPWVIGLLVIYAIVLAVAAFSDDTATLAGAGIGLALVGGATVFYRPNIGVLIIMSTMLMSYPDALKGVGPFTINNMLGAILLTLLVFETYRTHDYWFLREPEIRLLLIISVWMITIALIRAAVRSMAAAGLNCGTPPDFGQNFTYNRPAARGHEHTTMICLLDDTAGFGTSLKASTFGFLAYLWIFLVPRSWNISSRSGSSCVQKLLWGNWILYERVSEPQVYLWFFAMFRCQARVCCSPRRD